MVKFYSHHAYLTIVIITGALEYMITPLVLKQLFFVICGGIYYKKITVRLVTTCQCRLFFQWSDSDVGALLRNCDCHFFSFFICRIANFVNYCSLKLTL